MDNDKQKPPKNREPDNYMALGMCFGMAIGTAIGAATDNLALGMCMGMSVGMCLGLCIKKKREDPEKPEGDDSDAEN